jgi:hypothetical protein
VLSPMNGQHGPLRSWKARVMVEVYRAGLLAVTRIAPAGGARQSFSAGRQPATGGPAGR